MSNGPVLIENVEISDSSDCFVIAEIGNNHQGSIEVCKNMFRVAKECGANAVKLQTRNNKALYTKAFYNKPYNSENAFGASYGLHREALEMSPEGYLELQKYAEELGIVFFSTAFDIPSADYLESIDMPAYKIASGDLRSIPLLKHVASFGKPMIVSTGGGTMEDVRRAYEAILPINKNLILLQCTAAYPCPYEMLDLRVIETYRKEFPGAVVGLSSHDNGIAMPVVAYTLGARVIEKHFTLDRAMRGTDHAFSLEPVGLRKLVRDLKRARAALGDGVKKVYPSEREPLVKMGKKLVTSRALPKGHVVQASDLTMKCPGDGLAPFYWDNVVGQQLLVDVEEEHSLSLDNFKPLHD
jgi:sialic acid synthase